ncbi:SMC-Scp complex subunit ScpB [Oceanobacillus piezotolerans]|uniref:Segregation and condensation protein B n=1 Tax=Oceanobacillus piezotolerans TaxID=2448030 RepID=A0A498D9Z9_9BACI|nr:SMC-Scp complex subunit ScpB [Oceanobacillus piezotolerans]RLL48163.1 SMC-Scp complex subunit ScpB [Oceanobacillus piezotolerans]
MEILELKGVVEGLLFASGDEGISLHQLCKLLEVSEETATHIINELKFDYERSDRGIMIIQSHDILHLTTKPEHSRFYKKLIEVPPTSKLSQAALETLAIIAYRQPITRTEIEEIRGVKSDRPVQTLLARLLIEEIGRKDSIGRPILYGTSKEFLTFFGLTSLEELPPLPETDQTEEINQEADLFFERFSEEIQND